ncbi:hypothetical protein ACO2Q2_17130 [Dyella sp. KRB-257]|uniref:hypothetical protein n=1 Tax=Dyella sp. KRB-257 TaxID=3400915 RepID=UPI003C049444
MRIIETVGAIDVDRVEGGVSILQESTMGERDQSVFIPAALIEVVIKAMRDEARPE